MSRRIASVWDWTEELYHYYAVPSLGGDDHPWPPAPAAQLHLPLGDPPEHLQRELPPDALYLGKGLCALGEIMIGRPEWAR